MKRRDKRLDLRPTLQKLCRAVPHLLRGFVREGHRQNSIGADSMSDQVCHPIGDDTRFPCPCTCKNQEWTGQSIDRFALWGVETVEIGHGGRRLWRRSSEYRKLSWDDAG